MEVHHWMTEYMKYEMKALEAIDRQLLYHMEKMRNRETDRKSVVCFTIERSTKINCISNCLAAITTYRFAMHLMR